MNDKKAPRHALRFLEWFCPASLYEGIEGDLLEQFEEDCQSLGERKARSVFVWNVLRFFRPGIFLRNRFSIQVNQWDMIRNYGRIMLRSMMRRKVYSLITIFGLTVGITFSMMIGVFIWNELQVNATLSDVDRLYIMESRQKDGSKSSFPFFIPSPAAKEVKEQYPGLVEDYFRFWDRMITVSKGEKHFREQSLIGDSTFLRMFGFTVLYGDARTALDDHYSVVITKELASKYFGKVDAVGETLTLSAEANGDKEYVVTAVLDDLPRNSVSDLLDMNAKMILPLENGRDFGTSIPDLWTGGIISYIKLTPAASVEDVRKAFNKVLVDNVPENLRSNVVIEPVLLRSYYLVLNDGAVKKLLLTLAAIVVFIILMAVINFVNITIGSSTVRLKEIGVRKAVGGVRKQVILQFLTESLMLALMAALFSLLLYELLRPVFTDILATTLPRITEVPAPYWIIMASGVLLVGLLAGCYPAFVLSSYKAVESLKGKLKPMTGNLTLSRALVGVQFLLAICLFTSSIIISRQVAYFLDKDLGYDKSAVLTVSSVPRRWTPEGVSAMEAAKQEFLTVPSVSNVSLSWEIPNENHANTQALYRQGGQEQEAVPMPLLMADEDFASTYQMTLTEGKFFFDKGETRRPAQLVLNESARMMLKVDVGDKIRMVNDTTTVYTVAGIIKDFNFFSLRQPIGPVAFIHTRDVMVFRYLSFKLNPGNLAASVAALHQKWNEIFPNDPFEYRFMDERLAMLYKTEHQLKKASAVATVLMLIIVLLGVLGLASLSVSKRTKEIGIRKVLGASVSNILTVLSKEYLKVMLISFVLALPAAYYLVDHWLNGFAYRITVLWWMLVMPGALVLLAAIVVVCVQSLKAALSSPVDTLRYE